MVLVMAKLPTRESLRRLPPIPAQPVARYDTSAIGGGVRGLGRGISQLGAALGQVNDQAEEFEAERRFQEFQWEQQKALDQSMREVEPGGAAGFAEKWAGGYKENATAFLQSVPEKLQQKYDLRLFDTERRFYGDAATFARTEQKRHSLAQINDRQNSYYSRASAGEPLQNIRADYEKVVGTNPYLTPIEKDEVLLKGSADLEEFHVLGRVERGERLGDILRDLRGSRPDTDDNPELRARPFTARVERASGDEARAAISVQLETGSSDPREGVANISKDAGGTKSYGNFGLNSQAGGSIHQFVKEHGKEFGLTAKPGTAQFDRQWQKAAAEAPEELHDAEMDWYHTNITADISKRLRNAGVSDALASDARVQAFFADRSVQQGAGSIDKMAKHKRRIAEALDASDGDPVAFLQGVTEADRQALQADFPTALRTGVYSAEGHDTRLEGRLRLALAIETAVPAEDRTNVVDIGPYRHLKAARRQTLINKAKIASRNIALQDVDNGVEEIRRTGAATMDEEGRTALERAQDVLTKNQYDGARLKWIEAEVEHQTLADMDALSDAQIQERLGVAEPKQGDAHFEIKAKVFDKATRRAEKLFDERERDPAKSVAGLPVVEQAAQALRENPGDSELIQTLARARLDAQASVGISEGLRSPITKMEARVIMAPVKGLQGKALREKAEEVLLSLEEQYGPYARSAAISAIDLAITRDKDLAEIVTGTIYKTLQGQRPSAADVRRIEMLEEINLATRAFGGDFTGEPHAQMGITERPAVPGQPAEPDPFINQGLRRPPQRAIDLLKANPAYAAQFDGKYGQGASNLVFSQEAGSPYTGWSAKSPVIPTERGARLSAAPFDVELR